MALTRIPQGTGRAGAHGAGVSSLTYSVTVGSTGSALVVGIAVGMTGFVLDPDVNTVTWNGAPMTQVALSKSFEDTGELVAIYVLNNATAGTGNLTITLFGDPFAPNSYIILAFATEITNPINPCVDVAEWTEGTGASISFTTGAVTTILPEMAISAILKGNAQLPVGAPPQGSYTNGFILGQTKTDPDTTLRLEEAYKDLSGFAAVTVGKTSEEPFSPWRLGIITVKGHRLGGYTSYDLGFTVADTGANVLPEVEAAIRRGDRRHTESR